MILSSSQLRALKERNDEELRRGSPKFGYPAHTIQDLLQTIEAGKKEKKKWKQLAQERGAALQEIGQIYQKVMPPTMEDDPFTAVSAEIK